MNLNALVEEACTQLRRREIEGSFQAAKRTAEIMRLLITTQRHADAASLIDDIRNVGTKLQAAKPAELAVGNIVRRVLHMVREEEQHEHAGDEDGGDDARRAAAAAAAAGGPHYGDAASAGGEGGEPYAPAGLLSLSFKAGGGGGGRGFNRNLSLSNLLDQRPGLPPPGSGGGAATALPAAPAAASGRTPTATAPLPPAPPTPSSVAGSDDAGRSDASTRGGGAPRARSQRASQWRAKHAVIEVLNELIDELDGIEAQIAQQAVEHIHASEVILTYGCSDTTALFLEEAAKKRDFNVVVAEAAPRYDGHAMARRLADADVRTTLIADSAVYALMARANKVLVGAHAVLANGGVLAPSGTALVALAAKRHSVPFVVLVGLHKLSPLFPHDPEVTFNDFKSPADVADYEVVAEAFARAEGGAGGPEPPHVEVVNASYDYVPPHLVSLLVTDTGGYTPSYVYRLLAEYYSREDYVLSKEILDLMVAGPALAK